MPNNDIPPPSFRNFCQATIEGDTLTVTCDIGGHYAEASMDFGPIVNVIAENLRALHAAEHAGDDGLNVSGLGDWLSKAKAAAKKVASAKTIKAVWNKIPAPVKEAVKSTVPGGAVAFSLAQKTYETVQKARKGDKAAIASLKATAQKALGGNALAQQVMNTAKALNAAQNLKESDNPTGLANRLAVLEGRLNPLIKTGAWPFHKAKNKNLRGHRPGAPKGKFTASRRAPALAPMEPRDSGYAEDFATDLDAASEEVSEMVGGWFYNRPYRGLLEAAPSALALRSLYNDGIQTLLNRARR